jgi:hypothetical protein
MQVPIDTLSLRAEINKKEAMPSDFRSAFIWHLAKNETPLTSIVSQTGVSRDVLNKLKAREDGSTSVENGMLIAAFYGKTLNEFVAMKEVTDVARMNALLDLLEPEEVRSLAAQIRGLLAARGKQ